MKISEVADRMSMDLKVKITESMIRHYDNIRLIPITRKVNGFRDITDKEYALLCNAVILSELGYGLEEVRKLLSEKNGALIVEVRSALNRKIVWVKHILNIL